MAMVCDRRESRLNPYAPVFVPNAAYGEVEDFSAEWWDLVKTSPRFRDYWLSQLQEDDFTSCLDGDDEEEDCEFEFEELLGTETQWTKSEEKTKSSPSQPLDGTGMDAKALLKVLNVPKSPKGRGPKSPVGPSKYCEKKQTKPLSPKCTALRRIHQPR